MVDVAIFDCLISCVQQLCKEDDSLETMMENVIVLKQTLETAKETPSVVENEPILPTPETLAAQFNHRLDFNFIWISSNSCFQPTKY